MGIFTMSVANNFCNFCDMPLPKYLDSKTVLIYRPHPVYPQKCSSLVAPTQCTVQHNKNIQLLAIAGLLEYSIQIFIL